MAAVCRPPGKIDVVGIRLQECMLHVVIVEQDRSLLVAEIGELFQSLKVPVVVFRQVIFRQSIPRHASVAARPWLFEKRSDNLVVVATFLVVRIAPSIVPEAKVVLESGIAEYLHRLRLDGMTTEVDALQTSFERPP